MKREKMPKIPDVSPGFTKWKRLYDAFTKKQTSAGNRTNILQFIRESMNPASYIGQQNRYEKLRGHINTALGFSGLTVTDAGELKPCDKISTLTEADKKAYELRVRLEERDIHKDVLKSCRAELVVGNYFHAVFEAVKSVFEKLREKSGFPGDGHELANKCLGGNNPKLRINAFRTECDKTEQRGFNELVKGIYSMFRSTKAHIPKIYWDVTQQDAEDYLTMLSLVHRRLDKATDRLDEINELSSLAKP